ncbi:MAG: galactose-1-phosphate uridylyltransferase, partial [Clostridia bacterium]|nr:galactose-1-phosphate uridylyltransferase [Clostridia bacterium]
MSKKTNITKHVANLVAYAQEKLGLNYYDAVYAHNRLLAELKLTEPTNPDKILPDFQTEIIDKIVDYAVEQGLADPKAKLLYETKIIGLVMPSPSVVMSNFDALVRNKGIEAATDYLNELSVNSNYIRMPDIKKNIKWTANCPNGDLTITINLSKPEKSNEQVALERSMPQTNYPKCMLCLENLGFEGSYRHPARETIRIIPMFLNDEPWFMQYSPYVYFDNHCIAISENHQPMSITPKTFT